MQSNSKFSINIKQNCQANLSNIDFRDLKVFLQLMETEV